MDHEQERLLVERISLVFESAGLSPVGGRVIGRLLLCEPREQSSAQLAAYTGASKGSISTQTQMLTTMGLIAKSRKPKSRATWYAIKRHVWAELLQLEVVRTQALYELATEAVAQKTAAGDPIDDRLSEFHGFSRFFLERLPALIDEWRAIQAKES